MWGVFRTMNKVDNMTAEELDSLWKDLEEKAKKKALPEDKSDEISSWIQSDRDEQSNILNIIDELYLEYQQSGERFLSFLARKKVWKLLHSLKSSLSERSHALFHLLWDFGAVPFERKKRDNYWNRWVITAKNKGEKYYGQIETKNALDAEIKFLQNSLWATDFEEKTLDSQWDTLGILILPNQEDGYKYITKDHAFIYDGEIAKTPEEISN